MDLHGQVFVNLSDQADSIRCNTKSKTRRGPQIEAAAISQHLKAPDRAASDAGI